MFDRSTLRKLALELYARTASDPERMLESAMESAAINGLDWRQTLMLVEELERLSGVALRPLKFDG